MNPKKSKRSQHGFTLVEVIVVAVIVAAMAAVAVPMYLGYIESSRQNAASNAAGSVASFYGACRNSAGGITGGPETNGGGEITCTVGTAVTSIQIPADIIVMNTPPEGGEPGTVTGRHVQSDTGSTAATFNY